MTCSVEVIWLYSYINSWKFWMGDVMFY